MKNVALVLSSGGARGMAHIGVIEELLKKGFNITSIAGSSIGSVVGGFYAAGKLQKYKEWMNSLDKLDVFKLMDFTISKSGMIKGDKLFGELGKILGEVNIEDLKIPLSVSATDLHNKKEVVFTEGSLIKAMRASVGVPTLFLPLQLDGKELIDGGIVNPIPISNIKRKENELLVVVNLNSRKPYEKKTNNTAETKRMFDRFEKIFAPLKQRWQSIRPLQDKDSQGHKLGYFDLMNKSFDLLQDSLSDYILAQYKPDILVEISREACGTIEFYRTEELIAEGRRTFSDALAKSDL